MNDRALLGQPAWSPPVSNSPRFSVARITSTSFIASMVALSGCTVGLQTEGAAGFEQLAVEDLEVAILDAADRAAEHGFADDLSSIAPTPMHHGGHHGEEPGDTVDSDPQDKAADASADADADADVDEGDVDEGADNSSPDVPVDEEPEELTESWAAMDYTSLDEDAVLGLFADVMIVSDGTARAWGFGNFGGDTIDMQLEGRWADGPTGPSVTLSGTGDSRDGTAIRIEARDLALSAECSYAQGGTMDIVVGSSRTTLSFSSDCDPCMGLQVDGEDIGKVCMD
jgi:hypothetical protein